MIGDEDSSYIIGDDYFDYEFYDVPNVKRFRGAIGDEDSTYVVGDDYIESNFYDTEKKKE